MGHEIGSIISNLPKVMRHSRFKGRQPDSGIDVSNFTFHASQGKEGRKEGGKARREGGRREEKEGMKEGREGGKEGRKELSGEVIVCKLKHSQEGNYTIFF
jgi:hypothetical protein